MVGSFNNGYTNLKQILQTKSSGGGGGGGNLYGLQSVANRTYFKRITNEGENRHLLNRDDDDYMWANPDKPLTQLKAFEIVMLGIDRLYPPYEGEPIFDINRIVLWLGFSQGEYDTYITPFNSAMYMQKGDSLMIDDSRCYGNILGTLDYYDFFKPDNSLDMLPLNTVAMVLKITAYWEPLAL